MDTLLELLKRSESVKQDIKFARIYESYNAADLKKTDMDGYNANTQSFRQYVTEIVKLTNELEGEMQTVADLNSRILNNVRDDNTEDEAKNQENKAYNKSLASLYTKRLSHDLTEKYTKVEYKLFLCISVFYNILDIYKALPINDRASVTDAVQKTKESLVTLIKYVKNTFIKLQTAHKGLIHNYAGNAISVEQAEEYFDLDNLKNHFKKGIDTLSGGSSSILSGRDLG